ncbi:MAG TPA: hypothetical protein ENJ31_01565 [Anaerolineae bacterium]|nr:hypothetical protein [Anaerolineae bacterium]
MAEFPETCPNCQSEPTTWWRGRCIHCGLKPSDPPECPWWLAPPPDRSRWEHDWLEPSEAEGIRREGIREWIVAMAQRGREAPVPAGWL